MGDSLIIQQLRIISSWEDKTLRLVKWTSDSKKIVKQAYLGLSECVGKRLSRYCMHVKGRGGVKGAVRCIFSQLNKYRFAARLDIKSYYSSIDHAILMGLLKNYSLNADLLDIIEQYLKIPDRYNVGIGIVAGGALSPLLGAVYLSPLDEAMGKLCLKKKIYYIRYQDDIVVLAKSRWDLKRSLKILYRVVAELKLMIHTDKKRFIGRNDKGFSFLGYFFKLNRKLRPSRESLNRLVLNAFRLYEQGGGRNRLRLYLERWLTYFRGGLQAVVVWISIKKIEKLIDINFRTPYNGIIL